MFTVREEDDGEHCSVVTARGEVLAITRGRPAADALVEALEDEWSAGFARALLRAQARHPRDFVEPPPPRKQG